MQEIIEERQMNKKVFDMGNGQKLYRCHVRHIHYKDSNGDLKEIDPSLTFDNTAKKFLIKKNVGVDIPVADLVYPVYLEL